VTVVAFLDLLHQSLPAVGVASNEVAAGHSSAGSRSIQNYSSLDEERCTG
jgi:hypothetical protein